MTRFMQVDPDRPFRHLCPEADMRDRMDDGEFWEHVLHGNPLWDAPIDIDDIPHIIDTPCPVCGDTGPCGYDSDGLPYIHVEEADR